MTLHCAIFLASLLQGQPAVKEADFDLRGEGPLAPNFRFAGPDAGKWIQREDAGLRVTLPADRKGGQPIGVRWLSRLTGDFEITGTFELLSSDLPEKGGGVGVALNLGPDDAIKKFAKVGRFFRLKQSVWVVERWDKNVEGDYKLLTKATEARIGRLRVTRAGSVLHYLVAEGLEGDFQELYRHELGTEDLDMVRFVVNNMNSATAVDARLVNLKIRTGATALDSTSASEPPSWRRLGALWGTAAAVAIVVVGWIGYLIATRRKAGHAKTKPSEGMPVSPRARKRLE